MLANRITSPVVHGGSDNSNQREGGAQRAPLLRLPDEVLLELVRHVHRRRDLLNLSLTCRRMEDVAIQRLHEKVDIQIPQSRWLSWPPEGIPTFRSHIFKSMQELTIRNGLMDTVDPMYSRKRPAEGAVDDYIRDFIIQIPRGQLRLFAFLHQSILTTTILKTVVNQQAKFLQDLRFFEVEMLDPELEALPQHLRVIHCHSMQSGESLTRLIEAARETLEELHIGQEKELADNYRRNRVRFVDQIPVLGESFTSFSAFHSLPKLRKLHLVGLDLRPYLPQTIESASFLCHLESLTIESCAGTANYLDALSSTFHRIQMSESRPRTKPKPMLKSFVFRHEAFTGAIKEALGRFLTSFIGLTKLVLLFENATLMDRPAVLIARHGPTLESLVLESRLQPREHLGLDTSRPFGVGGSAHQLWQDCVNDICNLCPNLIELGMAFPWDDQMVCLRKTKLSLLKKLKTVHIRNFPQSQVLSQLGDYTIQEYARRFIEWCFPSLVGSDRPGLETLAIGPTLYENRWKCSSNSSVSRSPGSSSRRGFSQPEYLRSHYFCLDWAKTRFGRWHAMITPLSEKCMEELRDEQPLMGIFEHVWLR